MYLALRRPWDHGMAASTSAVETIAVAPGDAGVPAKPQRKHKHGPRPRSGDDTTSATTATADDDGPDEPAAAALTDADRRLEWRGDAVALPPQKLDMAAGDTRRLDDNEIDTTVATQAGGVRDCVVQGATGTDLRSTISIKMIVDGTGRVAKSRVRAPHYLFEHGLLACTQRALAKLHFPAAGLPTQVDFPVSLN